MKKYFQKISINFVLGFITLVKVTTRWLFIIILKPLYKFIRIISRFVFLKIIVKLYKSYLILIHKCGISHNRKRSVALIFSQKLLHITLSALTIIFIFTNLVDKTQAETINNKINKTILSTLIENEFSSLEEEELIEEFFDQEAIISSTHQSYLENLSAVKSQYIPSIAPLDEESENIGMLDQDMQALSNSQILIKKNNDLKSLSAKATANKKNNDRKKAINYIVKSGDSISTIAYKFGISVSTILWENNLSAYSIIRPGDRLTILQTSGISYMIKSGDNLSRIASKYDIDEDEIVKINNIKDKNKLRAGKQLIIPGGKKIKYAASNKKSYSGIQAIREIVKSGGSETSNKMHWPTVGHRITQYYSWRHRGLDIANKTGTPLYAADAGVVERAGWGKGYGNQIVINHGGGKKTRYAHASKLYVKKGQRVDKGEAIAAMGSTGWSTGPHIHFEVIINGKKYNPLNYIK